MMEKARSGIYKDNLLNRRLARVGERYGNMIHGGSAQVVDGDHLKQEEKIKQVIETIKQYKPKDYDTLLELYLSIVDKNIDERIKNVTREQLVKLHKQRQQ